MPGLIKSSYVEGTILEKLSWSDSYFSLKIEAPTQTFQPGQFVRLQLTIDGEPTAKSYSLVNAPENTTEVFFNTVLNGKLSNALAQLNAGDRVEVSQPASGFFTLSEVPESRDLWMFATGTGLGPYVSMLQSPEIWQRFQRCVLIHSVGQANELAYQLQIRAIQAEHSNTFSYLTCVTQKDVSEGFNQRFTELLKNGELEKNVGLQITPENSHIMLCGNHKMLDEMKKLLGERGLQKHLRHKPGHITTEQYF